MRIVVTNDDGIDSVGLHVLARALVPLGEVVIVAPDSEYSGASAALGALHLIRPEVHRVAIDGIGTAWSVSGPPALCIMFARLGVFGGAPDLVVSGINPGANVGRSVYHSGTIGAALTARNGGINAVAVSQDVADGAWEGQAFEAVLAQQQWSSAAEVAAAVVASLIEAPPSPPVVLNVNVPNRPVSEMLGWRSTRVGLMPSRALMNAGLEPKPGHDGTYRIAMSFGESVELPIDDDGGAVAAGYVSVTSLSRIQAVDDASTASVALDRLFA
jgi:5'-nucleotidase